MINNLTSMVFAVLIAQLGSDDFHTREMAQTSLARVGLPVYPHLMLAAKSPDVEVRARVRLLLLSCRFGNAWTAGRIQRLRLGYGETQLEFRWRLNDSDMPLYWLTQLQSWEAGYSFPPDYQQRVLERLEQGLTKAK